MRVLAFRSEFVSYHVDPQPHMAHLGEGFATDVSLVQGWARGRALQIADALTSDEADAAEQLRLWSWAVAGPEARDRLVRGQALIYSFADPATVWELSLRPVPAVRFSPGQRALQGVVS